MPMAGPSALLMFLARKVVPTPRLRAGAPARRGDATRRDATARGVGIAISVYVRVNALWM
jgi:hypothetical protein